MSLYDTDYYAWTQTQAAALSQGHLGELDLLNLAEEIESLGKNDWRELSSRLEILVMHLLKWRYQPEMRRTGQSWSSTIFTQRREIARLLVQSPSLRRQVQAQIEEDYAAARFLAADETGLTLGTFPQTCEWSQEQVMDDDFYPEASAG